MARKKGSKNFKLDEILRILSLLETNEMNMAATAREVQVDTSTIAKWKNKYWDLYLTRREETKDQVQDIDAVKLSTVKEFDVLRNICSKAFNLAISRAIEILEDEEKLKKLSNKDLNEFIKNIGPYAAEKIGLSGTSEPSQNGQQRTTYIQNIIRHLNVKSIKHDNEQN